MTGEVLGLGAVVTEITERVELLRAERRARRRAESAEQRAAFLVRAGDALASSLDLDETLRQVARIAVPAKADWCAVDLLAPDGVLRRVALEHADARRREIGAEMTRRWPVELDDATGAGVVVRTGEPLLIEEITDEVLRLGAHDPEHLAALRELGLSSAVIVPMRARDRVLGALSFVLSEPGRRFGGEDLDLALEVARRAAIAIENARLYEERNHIAQTLQRSLLPASLPAVPGFEVAARYRAAGAGYEVGGDFYDVFETGDSAWSIVMGDVCGKGPEAASLTSLARYTVRAGALSDGLPSRVLEMTDAAIRRERTDGRFMSVVHGTLALHGGRAQVTLANAGHPPVLHVTADGRVRAVNGRGAVLGLGIEPDFEDVVVALEPGDLLVAYTDGVLDASAPLRNREPEALAAFLETVDGTSADAVADAIEAWALEPAEGDARDDLAVLVLRRA
jgi:serine phosphatase RsbU (regulator of sigma subunit)